jgi:hypothetical protein
MQPGDTKGDKHFITIAKSIFRPKPLRVPGKTVRQRVEDHWLLYLLGVIIASAGVTAGLMNFVCNTRLEGTKRDYESKMASINRRLAGGDYFNISKLLITRDEREKVPSASKFYADESFYAMDLPGWTYKKMADVDFYNTVYGESGDKPPNDITSLAPLHVWTRSEWTPVGNHDLIHNIAPVILVQCLPTNELIEKLNLAAPFTGEHEKPIKDPESKMIFQGDIVGAMLTQTFSGFFDALHFGSNTHVNLLTVNKVKNILYCQILLTLRDVTLNDRRFPRYYINFETIVISTPDNVYTLADFQPSEEPLPRGTIAAEVTEWLNGFAIVSK